MSRIGKKPVPIPEGVEVSLSDGHVVIRGPKGELRVPAHPDHLSIVIDKDARVVRVERKSDLRFARAIHGTIRQLIANAMVGVTQGYRRDLIIVGNGYRARVEGDTLVLTPGFSHEVRIKIPSDIKVEVDEKNKMMINNMEAWRIMVWGIDKQRVGQFAATVRSVRPPDPYKGKGIRYADEQIKLRPGKAAGGA